MKLIEIINSINKENKDNLVNVDDWRWPDIDHLLTMGFDISDDFHLKTKRPPEITIYCKKEMVDGKEEKVFYIQEKEKDNKRFRKFNDVIDYFDTYSQPDLDKNK